MARRRAISFDLDSTLADTTHRRHLIHENKDETDWAAYSMACRDDAPRAEVAMLANVAQEAGLTVLIVSMRAVEAKALTEEWLNYHRIPFDSVHLCLDSHIPQDHLDYKVSRLRDLLEDYEIILHVDDDSRLNERTSKIGIPTLTTPPPNDDGEWAHSEQKPS